MTNDAIELTALRGVPLVAAGDDLCGLIIAALKASQRTLQDADVLVIAQKIVSKSEGRLVRLADVTPSPRAVALADEVKKDPRLVELILQESTEVVRARPNLLVVAHRLGFVIANAGIDQSNVEHGEGSDETALLLPVDPDATCARLCDELKARTGATIGVIVNDSHGRAFRSGTVGVAVGVAGWVALADLRGEPDLFSRTLRHTEVGVADEIAAAASLLMGQAAEGRPVVLVRGLSSKLAVGKATDLVRPKAMDVFRATPPGEHLKYLQGRRTIRRYADQPVADELLDELLWTAACAPSAHNRQPWRFAVVKGERKRQLAAKMGERLIADRTRDGDAPEAIEKDAARSVQRIGDAPLVIVTCMTLEDMDRYPDARRTEAERHMAVQSVAMAIQNLLLAAHAHGLGASVMCGPLFCPDVVSECLGLPGPWEPQSLITLGWPASAGKPFKRRPLSDVVRIVD